MPYRFLDVAVLPSYSEDKTPSLLLDRVQELHVELHTSIGVRMSGSDGHAKVWRRLGSIFTLLAKGIGAGISSIATTTLWWAGRPRGPSHVPATKGIPTVADQHPSAPRLGDYVGSPGVGRLGYPGLNRSRRSKCADSSGIRESRRGFPLRN